MDWGNGRSDGDICKGHNDNGGSSSRFFYCAKASKQDREAGLHRLQDSILARSCQAIADAKRGNTVEQSDGAFNKARIVKNNHPTVKPTDLMRYLCRLITPPGGIVLDPFMGSGSTGKAAKAEGFDFIGIELNPEYVEIARARIANTQPGLPV
jgi:site-specific DNA-methyltransferase (adenine-specific)